MLTLTVLVSAVLLAADAGGGISTAELDQYFALLRKRRVACGPVSAWYCLRRYGYNVPLERVMQQAPITDKGVSLEALLECIQSLEPSLKPKAVTGDPRNLETLPVPSILVLGGHCVVYDGLDRAERQVRVFDPVGRRPANEPLDLVMKLWEGEAIVFESPQLSRAAFVAMTVLVVLALNAPALWLLAFKSPRGLAKRA